MRICFLTTAFPRWAGDSHAPFVLEAARALHKKGIQVTVIAMHSPGAATKEILEDIIVHRPRYLPEALEILRKESAGLPSVWYKYPLARLVIFPFLIIHSIELIRNARGYDIVHAQWTLSGMVAWITSLIHRKPYVVTVHGSDIFQAANMFWVRYFTRWALNSASGVIAVSGALASAVVRLGVDSAKVFVIPDGVDTERFTSGVNRNPVILFVGSLTENKGVHYLIRAFSRITSQFPEMRLQIVGDGSKREELKELAASLGLSNVIDFQGSLSQVEVSKRMGSAKLFVLPSLSEGLGVVVLEALACGTPCIGSRVGGIPDIITEDVGLLVEPKDEIGLADAIVYLLQRPGLYEKMSMNARMRALSHYDWQKIAEHYQEIYERLV